MLVQPWGRLAKAAAPMSGARGSERCRHDLESAGERQSGPLVELVLSSAEERLTEPQRHGSAHECQFEVTQCAH